MPPSASPSAVRTSAENRAAAVTEAQRILNTYRPPSGATALAHAPTGVLTQSALGMDVNPNQIDNVRYWSMAGGSAKTVIAAVPRPAGAAPADGTSSAGTPSGGVEYGVGYSWPEITGVLLDRALEVTATAYDGRTIIRVDAVATWQPARDPASAIPATATSVTITYQPIAMGGPQPKPQGPVAVNDPAQVAAIVNVLNDAQLYPYTGVAIPCPFDGGERMTAVFHDAAQALVATATIKPAGCSSANLAIAGGPTVMLADGRGLAIAIGKIIDKPWPATS